jgi:Helix-turn-helix domain
MSYPHRLELTPAERAELTVLRDTAALPYLRERAAALLKVADGETAAHVARDGLLRPRQPDTLYAWLHRYRAEGIAGLRIRPGRGRKPAFSPYPRDGGGRAGRPAAPAAPRSAHL